MIEKKYIKYYLTFIALLLMTPSVICAAPHNIVLDDSTLKLSLTRNLEVFEDTSGGLGIEDIRAGKADNYFTSPAKDFLNYGLTVSALWLRFDAENRGTTKHHWMLSYDYPQIGLIDVYIDKSNGEQQHLRGGISVPMQSREFKHHQHAFNIQLDPGQSMRVNIRLETKAVMIVGFSFSEREAFLLGVTRDHMIYGIFVGVLLALMLYNLLLFISLRDRNFLYLFLLGLNFLVYDLCLAGLADEYIWPEGWSRISYFAPLLTSGVLMITGLLYARHFLETARRMPRINRMMLLLIPCSLVATLSSLIDFRVSNILSSLCGAAVISLLLTAAVISYRRGFKAARYFLLSFTITLISGLLFISTIMGLMQLDLALYVFHFSFAATGLLLSFAQAERVHSLHEGYQERLRSEVESKTEDLKATISSLNREIEQRRNAELLLRNSEQSYRYLVESSQDIIYNTDLHGNVKYINKYGLEFIGYNREEVIGRHYVFYVEPEWRERVIKFYEEHTVKGLESTILEFPIVTRSGEVRWLSQKVQTIADNGAPIAFQAIARDITERKLLEEQRGRDENLQRQQQRLESLGTLASGVAHEINNPAQIILGMSEMLLDEVPADSDLAHYGNSIKSESLRIADIVRNLLSFARPERQKFSPASVYEIVDITMSLVKTIIRKDQISIEPQLDENLPQIKCRSRQIMQVLMNLITNARDALNSRYQGYNENKIIGIRAVAFDQDGKAWVRISVTDSGPGIPDDIRHRIMDPFFTSKPRNTGTGLGLSISHGIVQDHGGRLWFESEPMQQTSFHIDLPCDPPTEEASVSGLTE